MRHFKKNESPAAFEAWKTLATEDWTPAYADLQHPEKHALLEALLNEQGKVCCYCGRRIGLENSHIEHFRPQDLRPDLALVYVNLHASCIRETIRSAPFHCGHLKDCNFDEGFCISPLEPTCEERFSYALDGRISPHEAADVCAAYMTELLGLDIPFLRNRREQALLGVFDALIIESLSRDDLQRISHAYKNPSANGEAIEFGHVVSRYAAQLLGASNDEPI